MAHAHDHSQDLDLERINKALLIGIILNMLFVVVEATVGFWQNSLALLSDAGHNLSDVASLALALLAFRLTRVKPNPNFTYGYRKTTILVALLNAIILLAAIVVIGYESVQRLLHPRPLEGGVMALVAGVGIFINGFTAYLFIKEQHKDLNIKGAYLHMAADTLVSLGVVIAGLLMMWTHWYWLDPVISFVIIVVILISTWGLLSESLRLSLDAVPKEINIDEVKKAALDTKGVLDIHHIHVWAMSTTQNALTAHLVVSSQMSVTDSETIKEELRHKLMHLHIGHSTLELETTGDNCQKKDCNEEKAHGHEHAHL